MAARQISTDELLKVQISDCMTWLHRLYEIEWSDWDGRSSLTSSFMRVLLDLYLTTERNCALKETTIYKDFLQLSAPIIVRVRSDIVRFEMRIEDLFSLDPYYNPWPEVCWRRSAFEAFREIYQFTQETDLKEYLDLSNEDFDPEDIDYTIENNPYPGMSEYDIPTGIPRSHWWWWGEKIRVEMPSTIWS